MENNSEIGCRTCIKKGYCAFPYQNRQNAGMYCDYYESNGSVKKYKNKLNKKVCIIQKVKCCNNCKHYKPEPVQPWEEGLISYECYKHDKITQVDNYCECYEAK